MNDDLIEAIVKIGNHPDLIKLTEPNLLFPQVLKPWMVKRVLAAQEQIKKSRHKPKERATE